MKLDRLRKEFKDLYRDTDVEFDRHNGRIYLTMGFIDDPKIIKCGVRREHREELYSMLSYIITVFDFSFVLEFNSIGEIREFYETLKA